jgi:hypothetical protein
MSPFFAYISCCASARAGANAKIIKDETRAVDMDNQKLERLKAA